MKRLVAMAAAALFLAPAAPAFGKGQLRAVSVCGPELCNIVRDTKLVADLEGLLYLNSGELTGPPPLEPFYGVDTVTSGGATGAGEFFPEAGVLRWRPPSGEARWLALPNRVAASLRTAGRGAGPYEPAVTHATAGGKSVDGAAGYTHLFDDVQMATPPSGETIPLVLRFRAVGRRPWPLRYRYEPSTDTLVSEGRAMRVSGQTASMIERDAGLAGSGGGTPRWAFVGAVAAALAAATLAARRARRRPMR
ncbi:MAG: hypothetical protein H0V11_01410 [Actinobacteria bacterium]|nr:hypothetical protein [Actinomycetota bacterium]